MSAIAGIVGAPRGVDFDQLPRELSNTFCRRAPDGSSYWRRENVFLFQGLLRTLPEDMDTVRVSQKEGVFLVADVRIDNRADLSTLLDLAASDFNALSDAEVLLECYLKWGEEFLGRIVGDFTLALWDGAAKKFLCARDRVGMRPFYYARGSGQFIFASEAGAVARILGGEASLNRGRVAEYIVREYEGADFESTFFNGVKRLPPGWCVRLQGESFHSWQYWKPDTEFELSDQSDADLIQQTRSLLAQAVQARLRCSGKVGFALSGGMDSSSIIVSARNVLSEEAFKRLSFFSATSTEFKESRIETAAIEAMLEMLGASAHRVESEHTVTFLPFIDAMMDHIVDPFDAGLATIALFSYSTARANGVRAFIDGIDGDTTFFSSTGNVRHLLRSGKFRAAYKANRALASFYEQDPRRKLFREIRSLLLPDVQPLTALRQRRTAKREVRRLLDETFLLESFAREISLEERIQGSSQHFRRFGNSTPREIHASIIYSPNLAVALERYNRVAAFCQVEPRSPLLDRRVLDFCLEKCQNRCCALHLELSCLKWC